MTAVFINHVLLFLFVIILIQPSDGCVCKAKDCEWKWSAWSECNCVNHRVREMIITQRNSCGGKRCPTLVKDVSNCNEGRKLYKPASMKDMREAAWASNLVSSVKESQLNKAVGIGGYRITNIVRKTFESDTLTFMVAENADTIIIAFEGSTSNQILQQLKNYIENANGVEVVLAGIKTRIFEFQWKAFNALKGDIYVLKRKWTQSKKILITGFSLGGSLATIFSVHAMVNEPSSNFKDNSWLITFGQSRVGDEMFTKVHDQLFPPIRKLRFMNEIEYAPHFPLRVPIKYSHISRGIWFKSKSEWIICRKRESDMDHCGNSPVLKVGLEIRNNVWTLFPNLIKMSEDHNLQHHVQKLGNPPVKITYCPTMKRCFQYNDFLTALNEACKSHEE